ncbi:MAG: TrkH family potassium uptake protein [Paludibacteraceae bacterium]|nr:TrkH family potassium uptake protein [Paludibacteraceae bacterium]
MFRDFNHKLIIRILGSLLIFEAVFLLISLAVALFYSEHEWKYFAISSIVAFASGALLMIAGRNARPNIGKREGSVIVTNTWLLFSLVGLLPFWLSGHIPSFTDAFFETMSGFTTTGASILNDIESLPYSILFWRSFTQWIGGLGIIVISMALLPVFGFSSVQVFSAEATGPTKDKIHPKMNETAKRLLGIYLIFTFAEAVLLKFAGMNWFDAVNHAFTTMATGGFSTKQASIGHWDSQLIQYIIILFMALAGINFSLYYFIFKARFDKIRKNEELRFYISIILVFTILIFITQFSGEVFSWQSIEQKFRDSLFTVISIMTTTGYATADYALWKPVTWIILLIAMVMGASAGSTAGGIKTIRILIIVKYCYYEFKRIVHPSAIIPVRYNGHLMKEDVTTRVLAFVLLYFMIIATGSIILGFSGMHFQEAISAMITSLSDVGPGLGEIGPSKNFYYLSDFSKWFLSIMMLIGRLELFTVLLILTPAFWKR